MREHDRQPCVESRRELARRSSGGLEVTLYWGPYDDSTTVEVVQSGTEETFLLAVAPERALEAYYHPFAQLAASFDELPPRADG